MVHVLSVGLQYWLETAKSLAAYLHAA